MATTNVYYANQDTTSFSYKRKHNRGVNSIGPGSIVLMGAGFVLAKNVYLIPAFAYRDTCAMLFFAGVAITSLILAFSLKHIRKSIHYYLASITLIISGVIYAINGMSNTDTIFVGSIFGGASFGLSLMTVLIHGGEVSVKYLRGSVITSAQFSLDFGIFISMFVICLGAVNHFDPYKYCGIIEIVEGVLALIFTYFTVYESPIFLMAAGNSEEALKNLTELRKEINSMTPEIQNELEEIKATLKTENNDRINFVAVIKILICRLIYVLPTSYFLNNYFNRLFMFEVQAIAFYWPMLGRLLANLIPLFLIDRFGRKPLFILSTVGSGVILLAIQILYSNGVGTDIKLIEAAGLLTAFFQVFLGLGASAVTYTYMSEVFDNSHKTYINAFILIMESILHVILINIRWSNDEYSGITYFTAILTIIVGASSFVLLPETKCKSLLESKEAMRPLITK